MAERESDTFPQLQMPFVGQDNFITPAWYRLLVDFFKRVTVPVGTTGVWVAGTVPDGYLECNGAAISRAAYGNLFDLIGTDWGAGDGFSTFNLPDFRGRTLFGASGATPFGTYGGSATTTLSVGMLPSHTHGVTDPSHDHSISVSGSVDVDPGAGFGVAANGAGSTGASFTGISIQNTGDGDPVPNMPPWAGIRYIIKAS